MCRDCACKASREWYAKNRDRVRRSVAAWKIKNKDRVRAAWRRSLLKRYGLTLESFDAMLIIQRGRCAICRRKAKLVVDHCHKTGAVRGLLCNGCNAVLGHARESSVTLARAISYLAV